MIDRDYPSLRFDDIDNVLTKIVQQAHDTNLQCDQQQIQLAKEIILHNRNILYTAVLRRKERSINETIDNIKLSLAYCIVGMGFPFLLVFVIRYFYQKMTYLEGRKLISKNDYNQWHMNRQHLTPKNAESHLDIKSALLNQSGLPRKAIIPETSIGRYPPYHPHRQVVKEKPCVIAFPSQYGAIKRYKGLEHIPTDVVNFRAKGILLASQKHYNYPNNLR